MMTTGYSGPPEAPWIGCPRSLSGRHIPAERPGVGVYCSACGALRNPPRWAGDDPPPPRPPSRAAPLLARAEGHRDGGTYDPEIDGLRLNRQARAVMAAMLDGGWHTLADIAHEIDEPEASISARLRDLRKPRFGGHEVQRRRRGDASGQWEYRLIVRPDARPE